MALTANFKADFTSFYAAVNKASASLIGFQQDAEDVGKSLDRMSDALSGKKLISTATLMVKAVEDIGGASKLTEAEIEKVSRTVGEASAKMERLGIAVPESFNKWRQAAVEVQKPTESWMTSIQTLTGIVQGLLGLQVVQWFTSAAAAGFQWASALSRMKAQTELSYKDLQILQDVAIQTGTGMETLTKGIQVMQQKIGDRSAREAIQKLGLDFDKLLKMSPADQFAAIAQALGKIKDPTDYATAAFRIFGGTYRELTPAIRADIAKITKDVKLIGDAHIEAADRASAEWEKAWNDIKKGAVTYLGWLSGMDRKRREDVEKESDVIKGLIEARRNLPGLPAAVGGAPIGAGPIAPGAMDPEMISNVRIMGETLNQQTESVRRNTEEYKQAAAQQERFSNAVTNSLERVRYTQFQMGQAAATATQNVQGFTIRMSEAVAMNRDFTNTLTASTIHADAFGHTLTTNVLPSLQGIGGATHQAGLRAKETATLQQTLNSRMDDITGILAGVQTGWAQMAVVGARSIQGITNDLISGNWVGAITKATAALGGFIAKMISGSEESKKVSPIRDEFFKLQGGLETLNPKVQALTGNLTAVQAVFDAKTVQQYDAAIANLNRILAQESKALDTATDAAEDYAVALKNLPSKIPIDIRYTQSGAVPGGTKDVPGYQTGTDGKFVDFGAGTLAMLHGKEAIVPESATRAGGASGGPGGSSVSITINAQGAFFDTPGDLQRLADKVNEALTAKYGLTNRNRAA